MSVNWDELSDTPPNKVNWDELSTEPPEKGGFISAAKNVAGSTLSGAGRVLKDTGLESAGNAAMKQGKSIQDNNPTSVNSFSDIVDHPGQYISESTGQMAGQAGVALASGTAGSVIGGYVGGGLGSLAGPLAPVSVPALAMAGRAVGGYVGGNLPMLVQEYGSERDQQLQNGIDDKGRALGGAAATTAIENLGGFQPGGMAGSGRRIASELAGKSVTEGAKILAKKSIGSGVSEGLEEIPQQYTGAYGGGTDFKDLNTSENASQALFGSAMALPGGAMFGGGNTIADHYKAKRQDALIETANTGSLGRSLAAGGIANTDTVNPIDGTIVDNTPIPSVDNTIQSGHQSSYDHLFQQSESNHGLPSGLLSTMGFHESGFNPNAVSPVGAIGVMQFMPKTAIEYGIDPHDPVASIDAAGEKMAGLRDYYNGDMQKAVAAYNFGEGNLNNAIAKAGDNWINVVPAETQAYVSKILGDQSATTSTQPDHYDQGTELAPLQTEDSLNQNTQAFNPSIENNLVNTGITDTAAIGSDAERNYAATGADGILAGADQPKGISNEQSISTDLTQEQSQSAPGHDYKITDETAQLFEPTHELNDGTPVKQIDSDTYVDYAGDEWSAYDATPLKPNQPLADANPSTQTETLNGSQKSTSETSQNANAQEKGLLNKSAPEQLGATPNIDQLANDLHTAIKSGPDKAPGLHYADIVTANNLDEQQRNELIDQYQAIATQQKTNEKVSADQNTKIATPEGLRYETAPLLNKRTNKPFKTRPMAQTALTSSGYPDVNQKDHEVVPVTVNGESGFGIASVANKTEVAPIINQPSRTQATETVAKPQETADLSNNDQAKKQPWEMTQAEHLDHINQGRDPEKNKDAGYIGTVNRLHESHIVKALSEGTPVSQKVLADYPELNKPSTDSTEIPAKNENVADNSRVPATKESKKLGLAITLAAKIENRTLDDIPGSYNQGSEHQGIQIHSINKIQDANGKPDYIVDVSNHTRVASNGHKTVDGKYSLNELLNSGAISQKTHDFLVDEHKQAENTEPEISNDHELTAQQYVDRENKDFPGNKKISDSLRKMHYTAIKSQADRGGKISQAVFDSLDGLRRTNLKQQYGEAVVEGNTDKRAKAQDELKAALSDVGVALSDKTSFNAVPNDIDLEKAVTKLVRAAFKLGYIKLSDNVKHVLAQLKDKFGKAAAHIDEQYISKIFNQAKEDLEGKNAVTGDLDRVNKDVRDAVNEFLSRRPSDEQTRIKDNLAAHTGTAWAAAAVKGMAYREMLHRSMEGRNIDNLTTNDIWGGQDMANTKIIKAFKQYPRFGDKAIHSLINQYDFIGGNRKAENDVSTSFANCNPSEECATHCYAAGSNARPNEIAKSEFTEFALEHYLKQSTDRIAITYGTKLAGAAGLSLRLNDKGDLSEAQLQLISGLNDKGIVLQIFSKRPDLLRKIPDANLKMLSIDSSNMEIAKENPDLRLAVVITDGMTEAMLEPLHDRVSVYLPVNLKGKSVSTEELKDRFPNLYPKMKRENLCPVDGGKMITLPKTSFVDIQNGINKGAEEKVWTCTACDMYGAAGCFKGDRQTTQRNASAQAQVISFTDVKKELAIKNARIELQKQLDLLKSLGDIDGKQHEEISGIISAGQPDIRSNGSRETTPGNIQEASSVSSGQQEGGGRTERDDSGRGETGQAVGESQKVNPLDSAIKYSKSSTPIANPHTKTTLSQAITSAMDKLFGNGWTSRLMATGKFKLISRDEAARLLSGDSSNFKGAVNIAAANTHILGDTTNIKSRVKQRNSFINIPGEAFGRGIDFPNLESGSNGLVRRANDAGYLSKALSFVKQSDSKINIPKNTELWSGLMDAITDKVSSNTVLMDIKFIANILKRESFVIHGFSGLSVKTQNDMLDKMIFSAEDSKILDSIVSLMPIDMMNVLTTEKIPPQMLFHDKSMLLDALSGSGIFSGSVSPMSISDLIRITTLSTAKVNGLQLRFREGEIGSAMSAVNNSFIPDKNTNASVRAKDIPTFRGADHRRENISTEWFFTGETSTINNRHDVTPNSNVVLDRGGVEAPNLSPIISESAQAFYYPAIDTTFFIVENISKNKDLKSLLLHEISTHALQLGKSKEAFQDILRRFEALKKTNPKVQAAFDRVPGDTKAEDITEEALAYYLEENPRSSLAQRIIEWFRQAVRAIGKTLPVLERAKFNQWANKLTEAELINMATSALRSAPGSLQFDNMGREAAGVKLDSKNNNIKFSRSNTTEINQSIKEAFSKIQGKPALGWLGGLFQRNHLIDFVAKDLPELINYKLLSQAKDNFTNQYQQDIAKSYEAMQKKLGDWKTGNKVMHELGRVQGMATRLENFDPAEANDNTPMTEEERDVFDAYQAMPEGAKAVYAKMRDDYQADLRAKMRALKDRISAFTVDINTKAKILKEIEDHFDQFLSRGVYFPLSRHGDIIVTATNEHGEKVTEFVESNKARDKLIAEMKAEGYENFHTTLKDDYNRELLAGNAANDMAVLAKRTISNIQEKATQGNLTDADFDTLFSEFNQLLINTLPDSSYRKHFIHRKGTLGESTDTLRAYAKTRTSAIKAIASLKYDHKIEKVLSTADKTIKEMDKEADSDTRHIKSILNELRLRESALKNTEIQGWAQWLTSLGFVGALGFNIGSAAVNMLQVPGVALPELTGRYGFLASNKALMTATKLVFNPSALSLHSGFDITKNPALSSITKQAMQRLSEIGKIDLTMTHDAIAAGQNPSYSSNIATRMIGNTAKYSGYLFHVAEAVNRQVTGMAAFDLAYKKNGGDFNAAINEAVDVIDRTQFDYGQGNRARHMMSNPARVLLLFKSYALGMSYFIGRNAALSLNKLPSEERLQARKTLVTSLAISFATAGLFGMPIGMEAFAAIGGVAGFKYKGANFAVPGAIGGLFIFQMLLAGLGADDEDDLETDFRNWLTDNFDQTVAEFITKGPMRLMPIGDISGRTDTAHLWYRPQNKELEGTDQFNAIANTLMGPLGSQAAGLFTAKKMYEDGEYSRMIESMSPAFMRNAMAAYRMNDEGVRNLKGDKLVQRDLTANELVNKVIGFNPKVIANAYDANSAIGKERDKISMKKSHLVNRYIDGDAADRRALMRGDIKDFNDSVELSERITLKSLITSIQHRKGSDRHTKNGLYLSRKQEHLRRIGRFAEAE